MIGNSSNVTSQDVTIYSAKSLNFYELDVRCCNTPCTHD